MYRCPEVEVHFTIDSQEGNVPVLSYSRVTEAGSESGFVQLDQSAVSIAIDRSSATISEVMIPTFSCEQEEPFECPEGPTRTLSVQWTAAGPLETTVSRSKSKGPCRTHSET